MFNALTANKSSGKHSSDQNTEGGRRCVSTHNSYDVYVYCIGTDMIVGRGLYSHVLSFTLLSTGALGASWY